MTRYNDYVFDNYGDFDEQIHDASVSGYREGVERVLTYIKSTNRYDTLFGELCWAIKEGII